jgi:hypothetical protein
MEEYREGAPIPNDQSRNAARGRRRKMKQAFVYPVAPKTWPNHHYLHHGQHSLFADLKDVAV